MGRGYQCVSILVQGFLPAHPCSCCSLQRQCPPSAQARPSCSQSCKLKKAILQRKSTFTPAYLLASLWPSTPPPRHKACWPVSQGTGMRFRNVLLAIPTSDPPLIQSEVCVLPFQLEIRHHSQSKIGVVKSGRSMRRIWLSKIHVLNYSDLAGQVPLNAILKS